MSQHRGSSSKNQSNTRQRYVPVVSSNVPNGGIPPQITVKPDTPIYSTYTSKLVGYGPVPVGTMSDAPPGHKNHGSDFHVIVYTPATDAFMIHGIPSFYNQY